MRGKLLFPPFSCMGLCLWCFGNRKNSKLWNCQFQTFHYCQCKMGSAASHRRWPHLAASLASTLLFPSSNETNPLWFINFVWILESLKWVTLFYAQQNKAQIGVIAFRKVTRLVCSTLPLLFSSTLVGLGEKQKLYRPSLIIFSFWLHNLAWVLGSCWYW